MYYRYVAGPTLLTLLPQVIFSLVLASLQHSLVTATCATSHLLGVTRYSHSTCLHTPQSDCSQPDHNNRSQLPD